MKHILGSIEGNQMKFYTLIVGGAELKNYNITFSKYGISALPNFVSYLACLEYISVHI